MNDKDNKVINTNAQEQNDSAVDDSLLEAIELSILFDFYGNLLNDNNKEVFVEYIFNDLSLSEIAENKGITRQGIHDIIKRTNKKLREYEDSLHLVKKFNAIEERVNTIKDLIQKLEQVTEEGQTEEEQPIKKDIHTKIYNLAEEILESL